MQQRVIRMAELASKPGKPGILPVTPATVWRWVRMNRFPKPFHLGPATTVWHAHDIESFIAKQAQESAGV